MCASSIQYQFDCLNDTKATSWTIITVANDIELPAIDAARLESRQGNSGTDMDSAYPDETGKAKVAKRSREVIGRWAANHHIKPPPVLKVGTLRDDPDHVCRREKVSPKKTSKSSSSSGFFLNRLTYSERAPCKQASSRCESKRVKSVSLASKGEQIKKKNNTQKWHLWK